MTAYLTAAQCSPNHKETDMGKLKEAEEKLADKVPPTYKTVLEWAEEEDFSEDRTRKIIKACVRAGTWEEKVFKVHTGTQLQPVKYYRQKPKK